MLDGRLSEASVVTVGLELFDGTPCTVFLAKASLTPLDVLNHAASQTRPTFPNDSTGNQFFDEGQFNAYLELGRHVGARAAERFIAAAEQPHPQLQRPADCVRWATGSGS